MEPAAGIAGVGGELLDHGQGESDDVVADVALDFHPALGRGRPRGGAELLRSFLGYLAGFRQSFSGGQLNVQPFG